MNLNEPRVITFWIAVILAVLGLIAYLGVLPILEASYAFWLALIGFIVLALGNLLKGM